MGEKPSYEELLSQIEALAQENEKLKFESIKYKTLLDSLPYGITVSDMDGNIVETNSIGEQMLGVSKEECSQRTIDGQEWRIVRTDGSDMPRDEWASVISLKEHRLANCKMGVIRPEGKIMWLSVTAAPIPIEGAGVVVIYHDITERKNTEDELSQVFAMSLDMICVADINTATFIKVNPAFTEVLGYTEEELLEKPFMDFIHPEDIETTQKVIEDKLHAGARVVNFENRYRCKDGTYRWLSWVSHPLPDKGVTFAVARDITELHQNQEALENSKSLLDATGRMAKVGGWILDRDTLEVKWTEETHRIHEVPLDEEPSLENAMSFFHPEDRPRLEEAIQRAIDKHEPYDLELRFISAKGKHLWTRMICQPEVVDGKVRKLKGTFQDITDIKLAQEALEQSEERLRKVIDSRPFPVALVDMSDATIVYWSQSAIEMFGHSPKNVSEWYEAAYPDPTYREEVRDRWLPFEELAQKTNKTINAGEYRIVCKDASIKYCEIYVQFIPGNMIVTLNDITNRKRMEEQIAQSQKMEAIGTLAGGIAHDFNNMLCVILGNISHALSLVEKDDELQEVLSDVLKSSKQAQGLTKQLLTFSRGGEPIKQACDINKIVKDASIFSVRGAKSQCQFELSRNVWPTEIDSSQISQVINNLIINANQAMPNGGTITVRSENVNIDLEQGKSIPSGRYVMISIEDTGVGIPSKNLTNIFEPYFSTKPNGTGLGLATVYSIIKRHGGYITATSELEKGTIFHIYLPASTSNLSEHQKPKENAHEGSGKILVMDDQATVLKMAKRMLTSLGYEVTCATNGFDAIEMYKEAQSSGHTFKAVILDLTVPGGMGGLQAVTELTKIDPTIKAIVSSGYSNDHVLANYEDYVRIRPSRIEKLA